MQRIRYNKVMIDEHFLMIAPEPVLNNGTNLERATGEASIAITIEAPKEKPHKVALMQAARFHGLCGYQRIATLEYPGTTFIGCGQNWNDVAMKLGLPLTEEDPIAVPDDVPEYEGEA